MVNNVFDVLKFIGFTKDPVCKEFVTGPMLFKDDNGDIGILIITDEDHNAFKEFVKRNPRPTVDAVKFLAIDLLKIIMDRNLEVAKNILDITIN